MKVAFFLTRAAMIRTLGPVIEAAIDDPGIEPIIVNVPDNDPIKPSATPENIGDRLNGRCPFEIVPDIAQAVEYLNGFDAVVASRGKALSLGSNGEDIDGPLWCAVFDAYHSSLPQQRFDDADLACWPTPYYLDLAIEREVGDAESLKSRACFTGYVRLDVLRHIPRQEVRRQMGLDGDRPVVLFVPDTFHFNMLRGMKTPLYTDIWSMDDPLPRLFRALTRVRNWEGLRYALDPHFSYRSTVRAVRGFCDRNDAWLLLASRRRQEWDKAPFTPYELEAADAVAEGGAFYPQSLLKAIVAADMIVLPYRSGSILETVGRGIPHVTMALPDSTDTPFQKRGMTDDYDHEKGDWPGVTWLIDHAEFNRGFANMGLEDFTVDETERAAFLAKHTGPVDGRCAERVIGEIKKRLSASADPAQ